MTRSARTGLLRHDHPASRIRALPTGRRDQLQLFDAVLDLRRAPALAGICVTYSWTRGGGNR